ncbi:hypothetical protein QP324_08920 [Corynebacterium sp. UMB0012]|uniref:hypothetical protein n=1 Tax=Corynebacterium sp. UMB0012 TaxID=3046344 RepID=UPI00254B9A01|nr:hypothetical protein [Corynebacterium sp. UMB0012]MDK7048695.1 hypothetical protein [Corynebacterium sp. UMB0012]
MATILADIVVVALGLLAIAVAVACLMAGMSRPRTFLNAATFTTIGLLSAITGAGLIIAPFGVL